MLKSGYDVYKKRKVLHLAFGSSVCWSETLYLWVFSQVDLSGDVVHGANPLRENKQHTRSTLEFPLDLRHHQPELTWLTVAVTGQSDESKHKTKHRNHTNECGQLLPGTDAPWDSCSLGQMLVAGETSLARGCKTIKKMKRSLYHTHLFILLFALRLQNHRPGGISNKREDLI